MDLQRNLGDLNVRYVKLRPVNQNSENQYSFKGGLPLIKFDIGDSIEPSMLNGSQLRLTGRITYKKGDGSALATGSGALEDNFINRFNGAAAPVDNITLSSKRLNSVMERITNYNRLVPSLVSGLHGKEDIAGQLFHQGGHMFNNYIQRNVIIARDALASNSAANGRFFSLPLYCGMLNSGADINLSRESGIGGLVLEILLKSDANVIFGDNSSDDDATYIISDLQLTVPLMDVGGASAAVVARQPPMINFNTWSSVFTTMNSSASVLSLVPGLSRVASVVYNVMNANEMGDQNFDSGRLGNMGEVHNLRYSKNGVLFPLQYRIDTMDREASGASEGGATSQTIYQRSQQVRNTQEALLISPFFRARHNLYTFSDFDAGVLNVGQTAANDGNGLNTDESFGMLYDMFGSGTNYSQANWSVEIQTKGTGSDSIDGTASTTQAVFVFFLNKNTVQFSPNGLNLIR